MAIKTLTAYDYACVQEILLDSYGTDTRRPIRDAILAAYESGQGNAEVYQEDWRLFLAGITERANDVMADWAAFLSMLQYEWSTFIAALQQEWDALLETSRETAVGNDGLVPPFAYIK